MDVTACAMEATTVEGDVSNSTPEFVVLASSRVVLSGQLTPGTLVISLQTGKFDRIYRDLIPRSTFGPRFCYTDYSPRILLPGLVDAHVHLNEPGRTQWEGFFTGTRAAACGGVTTVIDMPLNAIPPTTTVAALEEKIEAAKSQCWIDVGFYGGIVPGNSGELKELVRRGVRGFKGFLIDSGVDEFPAVSVEDISKAMVELAEEPTTLMFHAEMEHADPHTDTHASQASAASPKPPGKSSPPQAPLDAYGTFLASRPASYETMAIQTILSLAHLAPKLPLHIVHLSAMEAIRLLRQARAQGVKITAETCPHYLALTAEQISKGDTRHKCCPPIRSQSNQDRLWDELLQHKDEVSAIKTVVSDHSPCTPDLKLLPTRLNTSQPSLPTGPPNHDEPKSISEEDAGQISSTAITEAEQQTRLGNFLSAWGGISSVGLTLPILWTEMTRRGLTEAKDDISTSSYTRASAIANVVQWCCLNTARQIGLDHVKGDLKTGLNADICVFDDEAEWVINPDSDLSFKHPGCSPYSGWKMKGMVRETWLRGRKVFERGVDTIPPGGVVYGDSDSDGGHGAGRVVGEQCRGRLLLKTESRTA